MSLPAPPPPPSWPPRGPRRAPRGLGQVLSVIARRKEGAQLREAAALADLRAVAGEWLSAGLVAVRIEGSAWRVLVRESTAGKESVQLAGELVARLRDRLGVSRCPQRLHVEVVAQPAPARPAPVAAPVVARLPGPLSSEALARIADPDRRARLARLAATWRVDET